MKSSKALLATLFAVTSFPLLAQQPSAADQPSSPTQQTPSAAEPMPQGSQSAGPSTAAVELSPVSGELIGKLDSKTAKAGDNVEIRTKTSVKTASGTEIPKGSKLVGHVLAAKASQAGDNSQVALEFDHIELKGGQNLPVHSQIQSIGSASSGASGSASGAMSSPPSGGSSTASAAGPDGRSTASAPQAAGPDPAATANSAPPAGTIVAKTGNIAIATTSIPSVLLANNAPGQQDPRMAQASSILLGAKKDIQLDGGTQMVVGVAAAGGAGQ